MCQYSYLNEEEKNAVLQVGNGGDVFDYKLAKLLRSVEKKQTINSHRIIKICDSISNVVSFDNRPFFSCFTLVDGARLINDM